MITYNHIDYHFFATKKAGIWQNIPAFDFLWRELLNSFAFRILT